MTRDPVPRWLIGLLALAALIVAAPFAPWVVLGVWLGLYARGIHHRIERVLHGRTGLSATLTVALLLLVVLPVAAVVASLVVDAIALVQRVMASPKGQSMLAQLAQGEDTDLTSPRAIMDLLSSQGNRAWAIASQVAGAAAHVIIGLLIMVSGMYGVLVEGRGWYAWIERHAPMPASSVRAFADAFLETGRGLAWGVVGAGMLQSIVATIAYLVLGVPSALALGMLTLLFSVIPAIGTAIVWVPVAAGLAVTGRTGAAIALAVVGVALIGSIDNVARPYLARRGNLQLPTYVVLVAMFGGIELFGGWGILLGPLIVRLAKEAVVLRTRAPAAT